MPARLFVTLIGQSMRNAKRGVDSRRLCASEHRLDGTMTVMALTRRETAASAYNAAAQDFEAPALGFWQRHGSHTVALLELRPGQHVLDAGCGTGASALPAALAVGPDGRVLALDIAGAMLDQARRKAERLGISNVTFEKVDMRNNGLADAQFDAVVSVFSLFFVSDMQSQLREFWRLVKPGGKLAVTIWGANAFQPGAGVFRDEMAKIRPDLPGVVRPWERVTHAEQLKAMFAEALGVTPVVHIASDRQPVRDADDWWDIMKGTGYRWFIEQLSAQEQESVRLKLTKTWNVNSTSTAETGAIVAIAHKETGTR